MIAVYVTIGICVAVIILRIWGAIYSLRWDDIAKFEYNNFRNNKDFNLLSDEYKIEHTSPKSDTLIEIRKQLLTSIKKFVKQYYNEKNKPYLDSKYVKLYIKLNSQINEYFSLLRDEPVNTFWELDSVCNNIAAYKEACILLKSKKIK